MRLLIPQAELLDINSQGLKLIERAGRTCYKSEGRITENSNKEFVRMLRGRGHNAVLEFGWACVKVICDRGVAHEIVRHRLFSFAQESTRYCNYKNRVTFIVPNWFSSKFYAEIEMNGEIIIDDEASLERYAGTDGTASEAIAWLEAMWAAEKFYKRLINCGQTPQQARAVLPNSLKTEIVMAANFREWMHFLNLRTSKAAHPQVQEIAFNIKSILAGRVPMLFD